MKRTNAAIGAVVAGLISYASVNVLPDILGSGGSQRTPERMVDELRSQGFQMFDTIKQELPTDFDALMQRVTATLESGQTDEQIAAANIELVAALRRKHAPNLIKATDDNLQAVLSSQLEILELVAGRESAAKCSQYAVNGPKVLGRLDRNYQLAFDQAATALFRAAGTALRDPEPKDEATEEDWALVAKDFLANGGSEADIAQLTEMNVANDNLCAVSIAFFRSVLNVVEPAGSRVRAETAVQMALE